MKTLRTCTLSLLSLLALVACTAEMPIGEGTTPLPLREEGVMDSAASVESGQEGSSEVEKKALMDEDANEDSENTMMEEDSIVAESTGVYTAYSEDVIGNGETSVLFFHAAWCPYCKTNDDRVSSWEGQGKLFLDVYKVDYDTETALKSRFDVVQQDTWVKIDGGGNVLGTISFPSEEQLRAFVAQ